MVAPYFDTSESCRSGEQSFTELNYHIEIHYPRLTTLARALLKAIPFVMYFYMVEAQGFEP